MKIDIDIEIIRATVVEREYSTDKVILSTTLPSPFPPEVDNQPLSIIFETRKGDGADYVQKHFGIEPEVIAGI